MNFERQKIIESVRAELIGPSRSIHDAKIVTFSNGKLLLSLKDLDGPISWCPPGEIDYQEVLYFFGETPIRKYGIGALHPPGVIHGPNQSIQPNNGDKTDLSNETNEVNNDDGLDDENDITDENDDNYDKEDDDEDNGDDDEASSKIDNTQAVDYDFPVASPDVYKPSTMGITFCIEIDENAKLRLRLPLTKKFFWQNDDELPFQVNGYYEPCLVDEEYSNILKNGKKGNNKVWRRNALNKSDFFKDIPLTSFIDGEKIPLEVNSSSALQLSFEIYPRLYKKLNSWVVTVVLKNNFQLDSKSTTADVINSKILFQTYFEASVLGGKILPYPETQRKFVDLDEDEKSLNLLYSKSQTWAIGHGCAAGWDVEDGEVPGLVYADSLPAVELPSMTPDIEVDGRPLVISMRDLSNLDDSSSSKNQGWNSLELLTTSYYKWILDKKSEAIKLPDEKRLVAQKHLSLCEKCYNRMVNGLNLLKTDSNVLYAFKLTNKAMLLQQISSKKLTKRSTSFNDKLLSISPSFISPETLFEERVENGEKFGSWRAFQIAFLLMSLDGVVNEESDDREIVDLIWFPTGGGKTEAYLGLMSFLMFFKRLNGDPALDYKGTVTIMRYTLRMLTTQQFQRASSLICAMEILRRRSLNLEDKFKILGDSFSIGLWLGGEGSPNTSKSARQEINKYKKGKIKGNPMILTECPWCRCSIGLVADNSKSKPSDKNNKFLGVSEVNEVPRLVCPDNSCDFGKMNPREWIPVEVIDECIYEVPPTLLIATADKLAMLAYKPQASSIFGINSNHGRVIKVSSPPSLIIQDELHLISGPLGTMYGLYESIIEELCSSLVGGVKIKPKIIASTATIRGAADQVKSLYNRDNLQLFPSPGIDMADSFFGKHARNQSGKLKDGRLYLGIHANGYGSVLTSQIRTFSTALFRPTFFHEDKKTDPWWTLLTFYNSIRELGGAKTLFASDIRSRLKYIFRREGVTKENRRKLKAVQEHTSRLSQAEIVEMMDRLSVTYCKENDLSISACLASNIIEVGVDIDRLSLMGIVGQPKSSSSYIQITGRVGRKWWERPGLILTIYNPSKSRDRSHYEQFYSYHRRLYERVEPTSATPFSISALERGMPGAVMIWARLKFRGNLRSQEYLEYVKEASDFIRERSAAIIKNNIDLKRTHDKIDEIEEQIIKKWKMLPQDWYAFPPSPDGEYLMLWPGQYYSTIQESRGLRIPTSMRQVDTTSELGIPAKP